MADMVSLSFGMKTGDTQSKKHQSASLPPHEPNFWKEMNTWKTRRRGRRRTHGSGCWQIASCQARSSSMTAAPAAAWSSMRSSTGCGWRSYRFARSRSLTRFQISARYRPRYAHPSSLTSLSKATASLNRTARACPSAPGTSRSATLPSHRVSCSRRPAASTPYACRQRPYASIVRTTRGTAPLRRGSRAAPLCLRRQSAGLSLAWPWMAPAVPPISTCPLRCRGCWQPPITVIQRQRPPSEPEMNCAGNRRSTTLSSICTTRTFCPPWPARKRSACQNAICTGCSPSEDCASRGSCWPSVSRPRKRCCNARPTGSRPSPPSPINAASRIPHISAGCSRSATGYRRGTAARMIRALCRLSAVRLKVSSSDVCRMLRLG